MAKPGKTEKWAARSARLSAALRENLKKRKEQARARTQAREGAKINETAAPQAPSEGRGSDFRRNHGAY